MSSITLPIQLPPAQDVRPLLYPLQTSLDPAIQASADALNNLQEHVDASDTALGQLISLANAGGSSSSSTGGGYTQVSGSSLSPDLGFAHTWELTMTGNATINTSVNLTAGDRLIVILVQNATGGWQPTWNASYHFSGVLGCDPTPNTATIFEFGINASLHLFQIGTPPTGVPWP